MEKDNRQVIIERHDIRLLRTAYLRSMKAYREEGRHIVYTDETYLHSTHTSAKEWSDGSCQGLKSPISKGQRLIIVHAGGEQGFVPNALLTYKSGMKSGDYHDDMNHDNYVRWLEKQLIPNLKPQSVVVMDNASYHNVQFIRHPTSATKKLDMQNWLRERGIRFREDMTKPELYALIKANKPQQPSFSVDRLLAQHGHSVLRLPPYHPELNPIEKIWGIAKNWVASRNTTFRFEDVKKLAHEKFAAIGASEWECVCNHVKSVELEYMKREHMMDEALDRLVIHLGEDSESDSSSEFEDIRPLSSDSD